MSSDTRRPASTAGTCTNALLVDQKCLVVTQRDVEADVPTSA